MSDTELTDLLEKEYELDSVQISESPNDTDYLVEYPIVFPLTDVQEKEVIEDLNKGELKNYHISSAIELLIKKEVLKKNNYIIQVSW